MSVTTGSNIHATSGEAVFVPAHADSWGVGRHWFFPIGEGSRRRITVESVLSAVSMNSEEWYFVEYPDSSLLTNDRIEWPVIRKRLDPKNNKEKIVWKRTVELEKYHGSIELALNGKWLGLSAWNYVVLNTETGETQFQFQRFTIRKSSSHGCVPFFQTMRPCQKLGRSVAPGSLATISYFIVSGARYGVQSRSFKSHTTRPRIERAYESSGDRLSTDGSTMCLT